MSAVEYIVEVLRFAFIDTFFGVVGLVTAYVFLKLALDAYRNR